MPSAGEASKGTSPADSGYAAGMIDTAKRDVAWRILNEAQRLRDLARSIGADMLSRHLEYAINEANTIVALNGGPPPRPDNVIPFKPGR
jgi:hypothetical protein